MQIIKSKIYFSALTFFFLFAAFLSSAQGQKVNILYNYKMDLSEATEAPVIPGFPDIDYSDEARKNGVEGTVKVTLTLAESGQATDVLLETQLPHGVSDAVLTGMKNFRFTPAKRDGKPISVKMYLNYEVTLLFEERDPSVKKAVITEKPEPLYPEAKRAEKTKGKVAVQVLLFTDGTLKILDANSVLARDFDKAAIEAAKKIKFTPAIHKKSKKPVAQAMTIEYSFKP